MKETPLVSIICTAYNHEVYIKDALEGFLMQKTNFTFEIIISDDASTDKTASIIKQYEINYPQLFKTFYHKENQYSKGIPFFFEELIPACSGKYIAICEGDDFWTDPFKLKKQVDFLEANNDYGLCYTKCNIIGSHKTIGKPLKDSSLFVNNTIPTLTTMFKKDIVIQYKKEISPLDETWIMGDYPMWLYIFINSKIHFLSESTAAYRVLEQSASHSKNGSQRVEFNLNSYTITKYFAAKYSYYSNNNNFIAFQNKWLKYIMLSHIKNGSTLIDRIKREYDLIEKKTFINKLIWYFIS